MHINVIGLFENSTEAQHAVRALLAAGISETNLSLLMPDRGAANGAAPATEESVEQQSSQRVTAGLGLGAAAGGALGLLAGLGAFAIPGLGPILAAGPIIAALEGAGFGAIAGGVAGSLSDIGVPESKVEYYGESVREGSVLVVAHIMEERVIEIHGVMERAGALETVDRATVPGGVSLGLDASSREAHLDPRPNQPQP